jgi:hypothetical protein
LRDFREGGDSNCLQRGVLIPSKKRSKAAAGIPTFTKNVKVGHPPQGHHNHFERYAFRIRDLGWGGLAHLCDFDFLWILRCAKYSGDTIRLPIDTGGDEFPPLQKT